MWSSSTTKEALPGRLQEKEYLEKYVPFNVGLTPISFASLVGVFLGSVRDGSPAAEKKTR